MSALVIFGIAWGVLALVVLPLVALGIAAHAQAQEERYD
jgi:hypothetical protein